MGFSDDPLLPFGISAWDFLGLTHISLYTVSLRHYNVIDSNKLTHDLHHPQQEKSWASISSSFLSKSYFLIWLNCVQHSFSVRNLDIRKANAEIFFYYRVRNRLIKDLYRMFSAIWTLPTLHKKGMHKSMWEIIYTHAQNPAFPHLQKQCNFKHFCAFYGTMQP